MIREIEKHTEASVNDNFFDVGLFVLLSEDTVIYDLHINFFERSETINH